MNAEEYRVVIVDDYVLLSQTLANIINAFDQFKVIFTCRNGQQLLEFLESPFDKPDIILMDINMPILNGIEATEIISNKIPSIKIIALSMEINESKIIGMLQAGASGYLIKDIPAKNLEAALLQVMEQGYIAFGDFGNKLKISRPNDGFDQIKLTEKEKLFLTLYMNEPNIRNIVLNTNNSLEQIEEIRKKVFNKLGVNDRINFVLSVYKNPYLRKIYDERNLG